MFKIFYIMKTKRNGRVMNKTLQNLLVVTVLAATLQQCVTTPEPVTPMQTRILRVEVEPNPVAVGDTVIFTCIIEDSLDGRFKFSWSFAGNSFEDTTTFEHKVYWLAQGEPGKYDNFVRVDNGSQDSLSPGKTFTVTVVE